MLCAVRKPASADRSCAHERARASETCIPVKEPCVSASGCLVPDGTIRRLQGREMHHVFICKAIMIWNCSTTVDCSGILLCPCGRDQFHDLPASVLLSSCRDDPAIQIDLSCQVRCCESGCVWYTMRVAIAVRVGLLANIDALYTTNQYHAKLSKTFTSIRPEGRLSCMMRFPVFHVYPRPHTTIVPISRKSAYG